MIGRITEAPTYKNTCTKNKTNRDQLKYDIGVPIPNAIPFTPKKNGPKYSSKKLGTGGFWPIPKGANWAQPPLISLTTHHIKSNLSRNLKSCSWNHINHPRKRMEGKTHVSQPTHGKTHRQWCRVYPQLRSPQQKYLGHVLIGGFNPYSNQGTGEIGSSKTRVEQRWSLNKHLKPTCFGRFFSRNVLGFFQDFQHPNEQCSKPWVVPSYWLVDRESPDALICSHCIGYVDL